jgi:hypothetical protein
MKSIVYRGFSPENSLYKCTGNTYISFLFISPAAPRVKNRADLLFSSRKKTS